MVKIVSVSVTDAEYNFKTTKRINWSYIVTKGIEYINNQDAINALTQEYTELKARQQRTAELLQKAIKGELE